MAGTPSPVIFQAPPSPTPSAPVPEEEEFYSSWSLFLVCMLLILSLLTSYYLQIRRIRAVHETLVAIVAGMFVGLIIRLAPGTMIREMLVSTYSSLRCSDMVAGEWLRVRGNSRCNGYVTILAFTHLRRLEGRLDV